MNHISTQSPSKIKVNDIEIRYLKVGHGPKALLFLPGTLAYIEKIRPFYSVVDKEKYTMVIWDAPGYGYSRPPDRDYSPGHFHRDAEYAAALMKALQIDKYSLLGSCSGGMTAMIMASEYADRVENIVVWSSKAFVTEDDVERYEAIRHDERVPNFYGIETCYSAKYVADTKGAWIDSLQALLRDDDGNICREALPRIRAPTLILHGAKDGSVPTHHAVYLHENIKNSTLEIYPDCGHDVYFLHPERVYASVDKFLTFKNQTTDTRELNMKQP